MNIDPMIYFIAVILGLIPAYIARNKGRNFALWWVYGTLVFIVALPHAILLDRFGARKKCGYCGSMVSMKAKHCGHCGYEFIEL